MARIHVMRGLAAGLLAATALAGCAAPLPNAPGVMAMPGPGKDYTALSADDVACRAQAQAAVGNVSASQAANNSAAGSAVLGTALGALAGLALGSTGAAAGAGAAVGAGAGLLIGSSIGAENGRASYYAVQSRYDAAYVQCMGGRGERIAAPPPYPGWGPPGYGGPVYYGGPPPAPPAP